MTHLRPIGCKRAMSEHANRCVAVAAYWRTDGSQQVIRCERVYGVQWGSGWEDYERMADLRNIPIVGRVDDLMAALADMLPWVKPPDMDALEFMCQGLLFEQWWASKQKVN